MNVRVFLKRSRTLLVDGISTGWYPLSGGYSALDRKWINETNDVICHEHSELV